MAASVTMTFADHGDTGRPGLVSKFSCKVLSSDEVWFSDEFHIHSIVCGDNLMEVACPLVTINKNKPYVIHMNQKHLYCYSHISEQICVRLSSH